MNNLVLYIFEMARRDTLAGGRERDLDKHEDINMIRMAVCRVIEAAHTFMHERSKSAAIIWLTQTAKICVFAGIKPEHISFKQGHYAGVSPWEAVSELICATKILGFFGPDIKDEIRRHVRTAFEAAFVICYEYIKGNI